MDNDSLEAVLREQFPLGIERREARVRAEQMGLRTDKAMWVKNTKGNERVEFPAHEFARDWKQVELTDKNDEFHDHYELEPPVDPPPNKIEGCILVDRPARLVSLAYGPDQRLKSIEAGPIIRTYTGTLVGPTLMITANP